MDSKTKDKAKSLNKLKTAKVDNKETILKK